MMYPCCSMQQYRILFSYQSVDGHLGGGSILAVTDNATVNIPVHVFVWSCFLLGKCQGVELLGYMEILCLPF